MFIYQFPGSVPVRSGPADLNIEGGPVEKTGFGDDQIYGSHYHTWRSAVQLFGVLDGQHTILDGNYDFTKPYYEMVKKQEEDGICRTYVDTNASQLHYSAAFSEGNTATMNMGTWYISTLIPSLASGEYDKELCGNWGIVKYPHPEGVEAGTTLGQLTSHERRYLHRRRYPEDERRSKRIEINKLEEKRGFRPSFLYIYM